MNLIEIYVFLCVLCLYLTKNFAEFGDWILKWRDDFSNNELVKNNWNIAQTTTNFLCFTNNIKLSEEKLSLRASRNDQNNSCKILMSSIYSTIGWKFGKFEINASNENNYALAHIMLWPVKQTYGTLGKINGYVDIFMGDNFNLLGHTESSRLGIFYGEQYLNYYHLNRTQNQNVRSGFHVFALEWTPTLITWKIDNNIVFEQSLDKYFTKTVIETYAKKGQPFDVDFRLGFSNEFPQYFTDNQIDTNFTETAFVIDYVKYYYLNGSVQETNGTVSRNFGDRNNSSEYDQNVIIITALLFVCVVFFLIISALVFYIKKKGSKISSVVNENYVSEFPSIKRVSENMYENVEENYYQVISHNSLESSGVNDYLQIFSNEVENYDEILS